MNNDDEPRPSESGELPRILTHAHERYGVYSAQMSTVVRSLAITAVAVTWLLAGGLTSDTSAAVVIDNIRGDCALFVSMVLSLCALFADALHYAWASAAWGAYSWVLNEVWLSRDLIGSERTLGARAAWLLSPMFSVDAFINHYGRASQGGSDPVISARVSARRLLARSGENPGLASALSIPWSPKWLNRGSLFFFWLKTLLTGGAYAYLMMAVLNI